MEPGEGSGGQFCTELGAILPVSIEGALLRSTNPDSPGTKAWCNPALVARCGVAEPTAYSASCQLLEVDGVTWYPAELQAGVRFTSLQTPELVEVSIPNAYELTADILTELSLEISSLTP
ncbi:MAG: DUF3515 family protein [Candidatus Nanopelagicales bacterium]